VVYLQAYGALGLLLLLFACVRRDGLSSYSVFCNTLGLCALWPLTITLELIMGLSEWRWRRERARAADERRKAGG